MSSSRTNHQLHRFQRYPRVFPVIPYYIFRNICYLRVNILSIMVDFKTYIEPSSRSPVGGTVSATPPVIILIPCTKRHVIVKIQAISYNHICYKWYRNWNVFRDNSREKWYNHNTYYNTCNSYIGMSSNNYFLNTLNIKNLAVTDHYHVTAYFHLLLLDMLLYKNV